MASQTRFNIEVTADAIERAHRNDSYRCVVAQAVAAAVPDATHVDVDIQTIRFTRDGQRFIYLTPYVVQGYIVAFDAGDPIEPFAFQLRDPKLIKRQVRTEAGKAVKRAENRKRRGVIQAPTEPGSADEVEAVKAAYKDAPHTQTVGEGSHRAPPRVFKKKRRAYGQRMLRINREATIGGVE